MNEKIEITSDTEKEFIILDNDKIQELVDDGDEKKIEDEIKNAEKYLENISYKDEFPDKTIEMAKTSKERTTEKDVVKTDKEKKITDYIEKLKNTLKEIRVEKSEENKESQIETPEGLGEKIGEISKKIESISTENEELKEKLENSIKELKDLKEQLEEIIRSKDKEDEESNVSEKLGELSGKLEKLSEKIDKIEKRVTESINEKGDKRAEEEIDFDKIKNTLDKNLKKLLDENNNINKKIQFEYNIGKKDLSPKDKAEAEKGNAIDGAVAQTLFDSVLVRVGEMFKMIDEEEDCKKIYIKSKNLVDVSKAITEPLKGKAEEILRRIDIETKKYELEKLKTEEKREAHKSFTGAIGCAIDKIKEKFRCDEEKEEKKRKEEESQEEEGQVEESRVEESREEEGQVKEIQIEVEKEAEEKGFLDNLISEAKEAENMEDIVNVVSKIGELDDDKIEEITNGLSIEEEVKKAELVKDLNSIKNNIKDFKSFKKIEEIKEKTTIQVSEVKSLENFVKEDKNKINRLKCSEKELELWRNMLNVITEWCEEANNKLRENREKKLEKIEERKKELKEKLDGTKNIDEIKEFVSNLNAIEDYIDEEDIELIKSSIEEEYLKKFAGKFDKLKESKDIKELEDAENDIRDFIGKKDASFESYSGEVQTLHSEILKRLEKFVEDAVEKKREELAEKEAEGFAREFMTDGTKGKEKRIEETIAPREMNNKDIKAKTKDINEWLKDEFNLDEIESVDDLKNFVSRFKNEKFENAIYSSAEGVDEKADIGAIRNSIMELESEFEGYLTKLNYYSDNISERSKFYNNFNDSVKNIKSSCESKITSGRLKDFYRGIVKKFESFAERKNEGIDAEVEKIRKNLKSFMEKKFNAIESKNDFGGIKNSLGFIKLANLKKISGKLNISEEELKEFQEWKDFEEIQKYIKDSGSSFNKNYLPDLEIILSGEGFEKKEKISEGNVYERFINLIKGAETEIDKTEYEPRIETEFMRELFKKIITKFIKLAEDAKDKEEQKKIELTKGAELKERREKANTNP